MKFSKAQLMVIAVILLALMTAVIMMSNRQSSKPRAAVLKDEAGAEEQKAPRAGRFELPEKEYRQEEAVTEELIPEKVIADLEANAAEKTELTSTEQPGAETVETVPPAQEDPDKLRKKYPTPKQLREIKEQGLIIY